MILSLTVHEFAHAWAARRLGDTTAEEAGRLTLNPLAHIDPVGTLALPLILMMQGLPSFGWARPVPFDPRRFSRRVTVRAGHMLVAAAGPVSNLLLAVASGVVLASLVHTGVFEQTPEAFWRLLGQLVITNIALFVFNMIPVGPLDGQKVLSGLLRGNSAIEFDRFSQRFGWIGLLLVVLFAGNLLAAPVSLIHAGLWTVLGLG